MRVVSLFAGIGGFDLGFSRAGFQIVAHVEKDANCCKLLASKWPGAVALDDVCMAGAHNLPPCDVVTFGFPCQDLSVAGKRAGLKGERSGLFYEATRIIRELRPAWALFENVPGLLSSAGGADFAAVLAEMGECGYNGAWRVLDAQWLGVAQRRRRVFGLFTRLDSGAERCAEILSIGESLRGHPAPCREAGEGVARGFETGPNGGRFADVAPTMDCRAKDGPIRNQLEVGALIPAVARTVSCNTARGGIPLSNGLDGALIPSVCGTLNASAAGTSRPAGQCNEHDFCVPVVAGCLQERDAKGANSDTKPGHLVPVAIQDIRGMDKKQNGAGFNQRGTAYAVDAMATQGVAVSVPVAGCLEIRGRDGDRQLEARYDGTSNALRTANGGRDGMGVGGVHWGMQVRRLTPTECERLQGFPDGWTAGFSDSTRYRMLGNAVCVNVSEWIARRIKEKGAE